MEGVARSLARLSLSSDPKNDLRGLHTALAALGSARDVTLPNNLDLGALFDSFNTSDREQVELAVQVMSQLLPRLSPVEAVERFRAELLRGLNHPQEDVRKLVLKQVLQLVKPNTTTTTTITPSSPPPPLPQDSAFTIFTSDTEMQQAVLRCVGDPSLGVVKIASSVIVQACRHQQGLESVFSPSSLAVLMEMVGEKESTVRFNVYEMLVDAALISPSALRAVVSTGLLDRLLSEITTGDGLTQLSALQIVTPLAMSAEGRALLDEKGVTAKLMYLLSLAKSDPIARLLCHGLLEFLGNIGKARPQQTLEEHAAVTLMVLQLASGHLDLDGDPTLQATAMRTIGTIGSTSEGKATLARWKHEMDQVLSTLGTEAVRGTSSHKGVCLEVLTQLFYLKPEEMRNDIASTLELWWANTLTISDLARLARLPFPDLHCASLALLTALAALPWGQQLILGEPGLTEFILDRTTETDKQGMEAKYDVVQAIIKSQSAHTIFPEELLSRLEKYCRQGAFFVEAQLEVAFEGQN